MARKTFISYKYSEARDVRDRIIYALGDDASYYNGETADSPSLADSRVETIKSNLKDMMYDTSVTIVVVSPNLKASNWVDWEIEYSLKEISREDKTSRTNGIVGVVMKYNGGYDWLVTKNTKDDGCISRSIDNSKLYEIIHKNRFNLTTDNKYSCQHCKSYSQLDGSYISLIDEDEFISDIDRYIENAYDKCQNIEDFELSKQK